jgi:hypothetical protein
MQLDHLQLLTSLKILSITDSGHVLCPAESESNVRYQFPLEHVVIENCGADGKELTELLSYCPNLSKLRLRECEKVTELGVAGARSSSTLLASASSVDQEEVTHQHPQTGNRMPGVL